MNGNHVETRGRDRNAPIVPKPALIRRPARAARKGLAWPPQGGAGIWEFRFCEASSPVRDESEEPDRPSNRKERAAMHARD
jgi:hypothetical protein